MQRKESGIEIKVGALVLLSLVLFTVFVFLLGDFQFGKSFTIWVDFNNAGGLKPGADVRVSGIPAGSIGQIEFLGGAWDEDVQRHVYVRVEVVLTEEMRGSVGEGAEFVITTLGVLGEPYIEITNTDPPGPAVDEGSKFFGLAPVRIDQLLRNLQSGVAGLDRLIADVDALIVESDLEQLLTNAANLAGHADQLIVRNSEEISGTIESLDHILEESRGHVDSILTNVEEATGEFANVGAGLSTAVGDGRVIRSAIGSAEDVLDDASDHSNEIFSNLNRISESIDRIVVAGEDNIVSSLENVAEITDNFNDVSETVNELAEYISDGRGGIGSFIRDDEFYDDVREFFRELKQRPWRLLWRE